MENRIYRILPIVLISLSTIFGSVTIHEDSIEPGLTRNESSDFLRPITRDERSVTFTNVSAEAGFAGKGGSHFAWGDYDNDDNPDLLVNGRHLYHNEGAPDFNFTTSTTAANLTTGGSNGVWGDYDNDGFLDIFSGGRSDKLFHNKGDGTFEDKTIISGLDVDEHPTIAASWGDYNRDGFLDLYIANGEDWNGGNYIHYPDRLYRNNQDGTFTDVTVAAGVDTSGSPAYGRGVIWADYDNDGWQDIYISNYRLKANYLWHNNRDGTFTNKAGELGVKGVGRDVNGNPGNYYGHTIGSSWGDLDSNGFLDMFVSNLVHKDPNRGKFCDDSKLYVNNGPKGWNFTDRRANSGIPIKPVGGVEGGYYDDENFANAVFADYDNDGDLDLWITQVYNNYWMYAYLYRNNGDLTFTNVAFGLDLDIVDTYAGAWADYDNDGDMDLVTAGRTNEDHPVRIRLFRNGGNNNHWLKIKVNSGNGFTVGTQVRVYTNSGMRMRQVETGVGSHSSQNDMVLHFGLGSDNNVRRIEICYGDGTVQILENINADQTLVVNKTVGAPSITTLSADFNDVDEGVPVSFTIDTDRPCSVSWDVDNDGNFDFNTTSGDGLLHSYNITGYYIIRAVAWADDRMSASAETIKLFVHNRDPVAVLEGDVEGLENQKLHFTASATEDSDYDLASMKYFVDFGDGIDTGWVNFTEYDHIYPEMGTYTVTLTVIDDDGETSSDTLRVTVKNMVPVPEIFGVSEGNEDDEISFKATCNDTSGDIDIIRYAWDFGDDDDTDFSVENTTSHTYIESGIYTVTLRVKDRHNTINSTTQILNISNIPPRCTSLEKIVGDEDEPVSFYGDGFDTPSDADTLQYQWDFGDGTRSIWLDTSLINHIYTQAGNYTAVMTVEDDDGDTGQCYVNVSIQNIIPSLGLKISTDNIYEDDIVKFTGSGRDSDSDEDDLLYRINFGDGNYTGWQIDPNFIHSYNFSGQYKVIMEIMDNSNVTTQASGNVEVMNEVPIASFSYTPKRDLDEMTEISFDASASIDSLSDKAGLNYTWKMGSKGTLYGKKVGYTFISSGQQPVRLTVRDDDGQTGSSSQVLTIENNKPVAKINASSIKVKVGESVEFDASGSTDTPGDMEGLEYEWRIGSLKKYGKKIQHSFELADTYRVYLTVTDEDGSIDEIDIRITVTGEAAEKPNESGGSSSWIIVGTIIIIILVVGVLFFILLRKKKKPEGEPSLSNEDMNFAYQEEEYTEIVQGDPAVQHPLYPLYPETPLEPSMESFSMELPALEDLGELPALPELTVTASSENGVNAGYNQLQLPPAQIEGGETEEIKEGRTAETETISVPQQDALPTGETPTKIIRKKVVRKVAKK